MIKSLNSLSGTASLGEQASLAGYGLIAWVYQVDLQGRFTIDWQLTATMAKEIMTAYRKPLQQDNIVLQELRNKIADELEAFVKKTGSAEKGFSP